MESYKKTGNNKNNSSNKSISKSRGRKSKKLNPTVKTLRLIGTIVLSLILILIMTGSILLTSLTFYGFKLYDSSPSITLDEAISNSNSIFYYYDNENMPVEMLRLTNGEKRIWCSIENIPKHVQDAFVYSEDERFYNHDGVDFKRTASAFANLFFHIYSSEQGGSTITQQVVKNVTGNDEISVPRKIREIFTAMNLEKNYTKTDILECYLNIIHLANNINGVQAAANFYFDKDVSELTIAEGACIAAITKSPTANNPLKHPEANRKRMEYVLMQMHDNGAISSDEYESALNEELNFVGYNKVDEEGNKQSSITSYFEDAAIEQAIDIVAEYYDIERSAAEKKLKEGGFTVYTTVNMDLQKTLQAKFEDYKTFAIGKNITDPTAYPQAACIIMNYRGEIQAVVGGAGEKTSSRCLNRAKSLRSPGSCIKPIASYGPAIMNDKITWSTMFMDEPIMKIKDPKTGVMRPWPSNFSGIYSGKNVPTYSAIAQSLNTVAVDIVVNKISPQISYDFLVNNAHITSLVPDDINNSPMAVGAVTNGISLEELVNSYQMFGNHGNIVDKTYISKILDAEGDIIYTHSLVEESAIDSQSAWVMNRLMKGVTTGVGGTATQAVSGINCEVIGKTGTSMDFHDRLFVGCTPEYVAGIWVGFDTPKDISGYFDYPPLIWNRLFKDFLNSGTVKTFDPDPNVKVLKFCTETGLIANETCAECTSIGYYKTSNIPDVCPINHNLESSEEDDENLTEEDNTTSDDNTDTLTEPVIPQPDAPPLEDMQQGNEP